MKKWTWLDTATRWIRFGPDKRAVREELEAHQRELRTLAGVRFCPACGEENDGANAFCHNCGQPLSGE